MRRILFTALISLLALMVPAQAGVTVLDLQWTDATRKRSLPLRAYLPTEAGPRPTVLFSHGLGGSVAAGERWARDWAEHGLTVIIIQHPGSDESVWKDVPMLQRGKALRNAANGTQLIARTGDVRFVVDMLIAGKAPLSQHVDPQRIGLSGHSFGAVTTMTVAGRSLPMIGTREADPRIRAFIAFSPGGGEGNDYAAVTRPTMLITGTEDRSPIAADLTPEKRAAVFDALPAGNKYRLVLDGADHAFFGGQRAGRVNGDADAQRTLVATASRQFWLATLADDPAAVQWLKQQAPQTASRLQASWAAQ
jgi:predicted dienelactone hydrolase